MSDAGTPIDKILAILEAMQTDVAEIKHRLDKLEGGVPPKPVPGPQAPTGGLYDFVRPPADEPRYGAGVKMTSADGAELTKRALYGVRWNGDVIDSVTYDRAWEEIEALKAGDPTITKAYAETGIDPTLAAVLLLTGYLDPIRYDQNSIGPATAKRQAQVYKTPQSWIDEQFAIMRGQPIVSGGDAPE